MLLLLEGKPSYARAVLLRMSSMSILTSYPRVRGTLNYPVMHPIVEKGASV